MDATKFDYKQAQRDILLQLGPDRLLDIAESAGLRIASRTIDARGWIACHAVGRDDRTPSACLNVGSDNGELGRYKDHGGDGKAVGFFQLVADLRGCDWRHVRDELAREARIELPTKQPRQKRSGLDVDNLKFQADALLPVQSGRWAAHKAGVSAEAARACAKVASWPARAKQASQLDVLAFAGFEPSDWSKPVAYVLYRIDGQPFPAYRSLKERKAHLLAESRDGLVIVGTPEQLASAEAVWKCEGLTDALTLGPQLPAGQIAVTNTHGAGSFRAELAEAFRGKRLFIAHDADGPGERGAKVVARFCLAAASEVRHVKLPYPIEKDHGRDVRDYLNSDGTIDELLAIAEQSPPLAPADVATAKVSHDRPGNGLPVEISNVREEIDVGEDGKEKKTLVPLTMNAVLNLIRERTDDWPRCVDGMLFAPKSSGEVDWLKTASGAFGWLQSKTGQVRWHNLTGCVSREETFCELQRTGTSYRAAETLPHEPPIEGHFYTCGSPESGDGSTITQLLDRLAPETELDRWLMLAAMMTPFWGGPCGSRPCFVFTATKGRGKGKSTAAKIIGAMAGGLVDFSRGEDIGQIKTRLLTVSALTKRVALLDNLKSLKFSWAELESLITAMEVSGKRNYVGNGERPNTLTWLITLNGASLSTDMAQRAVIVHLAEPKRSDTWEDETFALVNDCRQSLVADIVGLLRREPVAVATPSRWAAWERGVLFKLPDPGELQGLILERQGKVDAEADEAGAIEDTVAGHLVALAYDPDRDHVFIPSWLMCKWVCEVENRRLGQTEVTNRVKQWIGEGRVWRIIVCPSRAHGRGFEWIGEHCDSRERMKRDIAERLSKTSQS